MSFHDRTEETERRVGDSFKSPRYILNPEHVAITVREKEIQRERDEAAQRAVSVEPLPTKNNLPALWDLVIERIKKDGLARDEFGRKKYGTRLQPFNGRDANTDAFQEMLDGLVYQYQAIYERQFEKPVLDAAIAYVTNIAPMRDEELFTNLCDEVKRLLDVRGV